MAVVELARRNLLDFTCLTFPRFKKSWHHVLISKTLMQVERGELDRVIFLLPPRHGKSELVSVRFPPWFLGRNPNKYIIACSYSDDLALDFGAKTRNMMQSVMYKNVFPGAVISRQSYSKQNWQIERGGGYFAAGVGGPITGRGAHVLLIDDPIKNIEEAESPTYRKKAWDWYKSTAYTRLEDGGAVIIIQTRWHQDDLVGRLLEEMKNGGERWHVVNLPAIATQDEDVRNVGDALWPDKFPIEELNKIKTAIGSRFFSALYQQSPVMGEGNIIKSQWFKRATQMIGTEWKSIHSWDTAFEDTDGAAYSCCQHWTRTDHAYYIRSSARRKVQYPELKHWIKDLYQRDKPDAILIEKKASGISAIQELKRDGTLPIVEITPDKSKVVRALANAPLIEAGHVHILGDGPWIADYIQEHAEFPNGMYADQVDATSQALSYLKDGAGIATLIANSKVGFGIGKSRALEDQGEDNELI